MLELLWFAIIGVIAGFVGGKIMKADTSNLLRNLVVGVIGAVIGGWLFFDVLHIGGGLIVAMIAAIVGAVILLWLIEKFFK